MVWAALGAMVRPPPVFPHVSSSLLGRGRLGGVLGALGGVLGASWARLGASWARLGGVLGRLGRVLVRLGASWERPGASWWLLGAFLDRKKIQPVLDSIFLAMFARFSSQLRPAKTKKTLIFHWFLKLF